LMVEIVLMVMITVRIIAVDGDDSSY